MSEYDSDAMDKATGGKNAAERDNPHIMRGNGRKRGAGLKTREQNEE